MRVTFVVTNMELVIMHNSPFTPPKKETAAGEGGTLFGMEIRPYLAVFQNSVSDTLITCNTASKVWIAPK